MKIPENAIETNKFFTWLGDDGIMRTKVKPNVEIDIEDAIENAKAMDNFYIGHTFPLLVDTREVKFITKEARDFFSMKNRDSIIDSFAMLTFSPLSKIIANFFIGINRPKVPVKMFDDEEKALEWLKKIRK